MEQDNERDYLGRQYGPGSFETAGPDLPPSAGPRPDSTAADRTAADPAAHGSSSAAVEDDAAGPARSVQVGTVVWGLVLTVLAVLLLLVNTVNLSVDPVLLVLCLTLGAGMALLLGGFLSGLQRSRSR